MPTRHALAVLALLALASAARADVRDAAGLFTPAAVAAADADIARAVRVYGKDLVIETVAAVPPARRAQAAADPDAFFRRWLAERAAARRADGVFVLVCGDPKYVRVAAGEQTRRRGVVTPDELDALRRRLVADLKVGQPDAALAAVVRSVTATYAARLPATRPATGPAADVPPPP